MTSVQTPIAAAELDHLNEKTPTSSSTTTAPPPPSLPQFDLAFSSRVEIDVSAFRHVDTPAGKRSNIGFSGGEWTTPEGRVFAKVVPGVGGEFGIVDSKNVFRPDIRYTVEFDDGKFGYVQAHGHGIIKVGNQLSAIVETDSQKYGYLSGKVMYAPGVFVGKSVVSQYYLPKQ